jgi:hypothetical protein
MGLAGCAQDPESGTVDDPTNSAEDPTNSEDPISVSGCSTAMFSNVTAGLKPVPNPNPAFRYNYTTDKGLYSSSTSVSQGYDVTDVCLAKANALRKATNSSWPSYTKKVATSGVSTIGCGVEYEAKLAKTGGTGHASANIGWAAQGGGGAVLVKPGDAHMIWYKAADTVEATQKWIEQRKIQCGLWQTWNAQYQVNDASMVIDYWNN